MFTKQIAGGTIHLLPSDLKNTLRVTKDVLSAWNNLTPLARNEWVCWVDSARLINTRARRIERTYSQVAEGKRRPCCWSGCTHRIKNGT